MPINKAMSHEEIVKEIMDSYHKKGTIKTYTPKDEEDALRMANAIAYKVKEK